MQPSGAAPVAVIGDRLWRERLGGANVLALLVSEAPPQPSSESLPQDSSALGVTPGHNLAIRVSGDVGQAVSAVRTSLRQAEPGLVLDNVGTMALRSSATSSANDSWRTWPPHSQRYRCSSAAWGCTACSPTPSRVARRNLGVRLTLGASPGDLTRDVFGDAMRVGVAGTVIGLVAALWAAGLLEALLFEVSAFDPVVAVVSATVLAAATLAAGYLPARRAARVNPIAALRAD